MIAVPGMRLGAQLGRPLSPGANAVDGLVATVADARRYGLHSVYLTQAFQFDALTALAVVGRAVPDIELGTGVVPTYPRHPLALAEQALTTQAAVDGRLVLGVGPSHREPIERIYGYSFDHAVRNVAEYLDILLPALDGKAVDLHGRWWTASADRLEVAGASACPVLIGAMGPRMCALAGAVAAGTITSTTGPRTLASHIVPAVAAAAREAGRPAPRIVACLPFCLTDDRDAAHEQASREFAHSATYPTYRAMLDREGVAHPADIALIGDEAALATQLAALRDAGVTEFLAKVFGSEAQRRRSLELLGSLADR